MELRLRATRTTSLREIASHFSGISPFHAHQGEITLMTDRITLRDESELHISLTDLEQWYLGFDENFPRSSVKNFGLFWQPLSILMKERIIDIKRILNTD